MRGYYFKAKGAREMYQLRKTHLLTEASRNFKSVLGGINITIDLQLYLSLCRYLSEHFFKAWSALF